jgi:hypothetical protein
MVYGNEMLKFTCEIVRHCEFHLHLIRINFHYISKEIISVTYRTGFHFCKVFQTACFQKFVIVCYLCALLGHIRQYEGRFWESK